jgi:serine protease Do
MKKNPMTMMALSLGLALLSPVLLFAQKDEKGDRGKKDVQQIIITNKGDKDGKIVVEINGDKVTVNGKPLEEYKEKSGDINVRVHKLKQLESLSRIPGMSGNWSYGDDWMNLYSSNENRAMLGVTTDKTDGGVEIQDVTKESAAEKAGLKKDDIITKVDDIKIEDPDDLSAAIKKHKPCDKVSITYLRDKKEQKVSAELTRWKGVSAFGFTAPGQGFNFDMGDMKFDVPKPAIPRTTAPFGQTWSWSGGSPKLGLSVQDTDDGKGVKVIEVDEESNAEKAGVKENDIITQVDDKAVNSVDEISKLLREKKENLTVKLQVTRNGKSQAIEVKMPRKIKTADL